MKRHHVLRWMFLVLSCSTAPAHAKDAIASDVRQFAAGETVTLRPDRVYILLRVDTSLDRAFKFLPNILRVPARDEIEQYEVARKAAYEKAGNKAGSYDNFAFNYQGRANLYQITKARKIQQADGFAEVLIEAPVGSYIVYGVGGECFCFGTVGFTPEAGMITDIGAMRFAYAWRPSSDPEFAEETGLGKSADMAVGLLAASLRPSVSVDMARATLSGVDPNKIVLAKFHAVGTFVDRGAGLVNRLAAMPGVLAYREGRVIDVPTGRDITTAP